MSWDCFSTLRFVRESDIQDLGLVSEIYRRLYNCGFHPDEEKIFLVPGKGWEMIDDRSHCCSVVLQSLKILVLVKV